MGRPARRNLDRAGVVAARRTVSLSDLVSTYAVVVFSVAVQGLSLGPLLKRYASQGRS